MSTAQLTSPAPGYGRLSGVVDFSTVTGLATAASALFREQSALGLKQVEIDLADLESTNSAGLALLLEWMEMAHPHGIRLTYRHLPDSLLRMADFSNLQTLLPVVGCRLSVNQ